MDSKSALLSACVIACTVLVSAGAPCSAAELSVTVAAPSGSPVEGAVVVAEPVLGQGPGPGQAASRPRTGLKAVMDQRELQYVPDVLVVQTGTAVEFPNSDDVRHQVYSFSPAKTFKLALYSGHGHGSVLFDRAGVVTLGCNIHDSMVGYIYVTDSPWFGRTNFDGIVRLHNLPAGDYTLHVWHALLNEKGPHLQSRVTLSEATSASANFRLQRALRPASQNHGANKQWADY